jgi:hypothetical protein
MHFFNMCTMFLFCTCGDAFLGSAASSDRETFTCRKYNNPQHISVSMFRYSSHKRGGSSRSVDSRLTVHNGDGKGGSPSPRARARSFSSLRSGLRKSSFSSLRQRRYQGMALTSFAHRFLTDKNGSNDSSLSTDFRFDFPMTTVFFKT